MLTTIPIRKARSSLSEFFMTDIGIYKKIDNQLAGGGMRTHGFPGKLQYATDDDLIALFVAGVFKDHARNYTLCDIVSSFLSFKSESFSLTGPGKINPSVKLYSRGTTLMEVLKAILHTKNYYLCEAFFKVSTDIINSFVIIDVFDKTNDSWVKITFWGSADTTDDQTNITRLYKGVCAHDWKLSLSKSERMCQIFDQPRSMERSITETFHSATRSPPL